MSKKIISGIGKGFSQFFVFIILIACCLAIGAVFVYPTWFWASSSPATYSYFVLLLCGAGLVYFIVRHGVSSFEKKHKRNR